ncbi:MAG: hypothetical protein ACREFE_09620 [Limisphaerales bacterium]
MQFFDWLIREHGNFLTKLFLYVGLPLAAWFLGRRAGRKKRKQGNTFVLVIRPPGKSISPVSRWTFEPGDDDNNPFQN